MSDNHQEQENGKKNIKKAKTGKKYQGKKLIAILLASATIVGGGLHQVTYGTDHTKKAVTEEQLDQIQKNEQIANLNTLEELSKSDKASDLVQIGNIVTQYTDSEKLTSLKQTYTKLLQQTVANTYGINPEKVTINEEEKKISLNLANKVTIDLYSQDFLKDYFKDGITGIGKQALALIKGNTMSSEFNTAFEDLAKLTNLIEKCNNDEITLKEIKKDLKQIYQHVAIFQIAKGKTNGKNIRLEHPKKDSKSTEGLEW